MTSLFSATTRVYLRDEIYSIILTASLNLEIIFRTSYPCLLHIFPSGLHMYVSGELC